MSVTPIMQAYALTEKAAHEGFDWDSALMAAEKVREELEEVIDELRKPDTPNRHKALEDEIGDLFMACSCLARHTNINPDEAILKGIEKFRRRYEHFKNYLADRGVTLSDLSRNEMRALWRESRVQ